MTGLDRAVADLAASQYGLITRTQAIASGATRSALAHRIACGRWEVVHPTVFRIAGAPITGRQRAMAATLWVGSRGAVSHLAAAAIERLGTDAPSEIAVSISRNHDLRSDDVVVHRTLELPDVDIRVVDGIR